MKKKEYKKWVNTFGLTFMSWLSVLPLCDAVTGEAITLTNPVPIVMFPLEDLPRLTKELKKNGFHFANSTVWYVYGYHKPKGYADRALIKDVA